MRSDPPLAALEPGRSFSGVYACTRKDLLVARNGQPYLAVELADSSGTITARAFRDAAALANGFEQGDLVEVVGRVERFRGERTVELASIRRADRSAVDPRRFLPSTARDLDELDGFFEALAAELACPVLAPLVQLFVHDEGFRTQFRLAPCTREGHHAYLGGLLEHTVAVATLAHELCQVHPWLDRDLLLAAALLHDVGKTREFELGAEIALSSEGALLGHLALGQRMIEERWSALAADRTAAGPLARVPAADREARFQSLLHCVLAHHGPDQLPSRRFRSAEAAALYRLNQLDTAVGAWMGSPVA